MLKKRTEKWPTASELKRRLEADSSWVARQTIEEARLAADRLILQEAEVPLLEDLASVGVSNIDSIWKLRNIAEFPHAIPILVSHLRRPYPPRIWEGIVRSLCDRACRVGIAPELIQAFLSIEGEDQRSDDLRAATGFTISKVALPSDFDAIATLILKPGLGDHARISLIEGLARTGKDRAIHVLTKLLDCSAVAPFAIKALGRLRAVDALDKIQAFATSPESRIRRLVRDATSRIRG